MLLFLEGQSKSGKSTLLRECLGPYQSLLGGFASQRLWEEGLPRAYRLMPASDFLLDADYAPSLDHVFRYHRQKHPEVFKTYGVELLLDSCRHPLVLLDEIGGAELLVPEFRQALYEVLAGPVPCIGVLKEAEKAQFMKQAAGYSEDVISYNLQLRQYMKQLPDCRILHFDRENRDTVKAEIDLFLERIFSHVDVI